jgi:hypothetical protein
MATSITISGISAQELDGSAKVSVDKGKFTGTRIFKVAWGDQLSFIQALLGAQTVDKQTGNLVRRVPPRFPTYEFLVCKRIDVVGFGSMSKDSDDDPTYEFAKITAVYEQAEANDPSTEQQDVQDETEETLSTTYGAEALSFDGKNARWTSTSTKVNSELQTFKLLGTIDHTYTRRNVPAVPRSALRKAGTVNAAEFNGADAGYLLFLGATVEPVTSTTGVRVYNVTYQFKERIDATWNEFYNTETGEWDSLYIQNSDGNWEPYTPYESEDFSNIFGLNI